MFLFLNWNLFLAFVPYLISCILLKQKYKKRGTPYLFLIGLGTWLIFFPNAPYIITDICHIRHSERTFLWFDIFMVFMFAWVGLIYGILSMINIEKALRARLKSKKLHVFLSIAFLILGSYGIYLGRFQRWNTWDILRNPFQLFQDILDTLAHPLQHSDAWVVTGFFSVLLISSYYMFKLITNPTLPDIKRSE